ncbi:efflux RND transporter permease subunit [uncultured Shewanella sp.]|uniref:efflux RND transporter permease subunit n=1 Tax=uncultured Shewanella sp. TaxID=173975 RepID=UPI002638A629|nr:efflux RND transporter permease subunit [uncultured Shewanella sp.]
MSKKTGDSSVPGVYEVTLLGARQYAMRVWLEPHKMAAKGVEAADVIAALEDYNLRSTAGSMDSAWITLELSASTNISSQEAFDNIVIRHVNGHFVRIKDIGYSEFGAVDYTQGAIYKGDPAVIMAVSSSDHTNAITTANKVIELLPLLQAKAPEGLNIELNWNVTAFSQAVVDEVYRAFIEAIICVFIIICLFMGSIRAIAIPLVTVPFSILGAAMGMYAMGYSLNSLTLLAWVLAIGLVVDDAIILVENTHRHIMQGMGPFDAALKSVSELRMAIITITLCIAIVFIPIAFVPGYTSALFTEFALTLSFVVVISGLLALFVSPSMCSKLLQQRMQESRFTHYSEHCFHIIRVQYRRLLRQLLTMPGFVGLIFVGLMIGGGVLYNKLPTDLMQLENTGAINTLGLGPDNANYEYIAHYSQPLAHIYQSIPEGKAWGMFNGIPAFGGATNSMSFILLKPEFLSKEDEILDQVQRQVSELGGFEAFSFKLNTVPGGDQQPLSFVLTTSGSYEELSYQVDKLMNILDNYPGIMSQSTTFRFDNPLLQLNINRDKAAELGVSVASINDTLNTFLGKPVSTFFERKGYSYQVIPQVPRAFRMGGDDLKTVYVRSDSGDMIGLDNLVSVTQTVVPQTLAQFNQMRSATITASIGADYTLGQAVAFLEDYAAHSLPNHYGYDFTSQARDFLRSGSQLSMAFSFALILIYILLVMHFNSFVDPLIVMLSVPLAVVGALYLMYLTDTSLNIYTKMGLIMLVGLTSKNGILIVDFANQIRVEGKHLRQAIIAGAATRLRPVLMTAAAMVFGALPLVISSGAGAVARNQIGWVIIGGMVLGTCLTLFVVPVAYLFINDNVKRFGSHNEGHSANATSLN